MARKRLKFEVSDEDQLASSECVIDLCSSDNGTSSGTDSSSDESCCILEENFSPVKAKFVRSSEVAIPNACVGEYHDEDTRTIPIMARPLSGLSVKQLFQLMIGEVPRDCVCHRKPTGVTYSSIFVVDLSCVTRLEDLRADDNGVWVHGGKPRRKYVVDVNSLNEVVDAIPAGENEDNENVFTLVRSYHRHKVTPEFQRRISYVYDSSGQLVSYAVMQYLFDGGVDVPVTVLPHGNAKKQVTAYRRTQKSTLEKVKKQGGKPKHVVSLLHDEAGGSLEARSASELPRDRRQVYNARQVAGSGGSSSGKLDPCFDLIRQCKEDSLPGGRKFVRSVNIDSSLSCVLASETQLKNVVRFCTQDGAFCVLGVDATFDLGKFYVTITTYTYEHVVNKTTGVSPTFIGPIYLHTEKTFEAYYSFFSTLLKLEPQLSGIKAFGTDGEQALVNAIAAVFPCDVVQLRCFIHMRDNVCRKLTDMLFPESVRSDFLRDIFGSQQGSMYINGLVDASDEKDFDQRFEALNKKWQVMEISVHPHKDPSFHAWMLKYKAEVMKNTMIASVRSKAGLGSPPGRYTTNRNESINNLVQAFTNYSKSTWVDLNNKLHQLVVGQQKEVERSIFQMGEYRFKANYRYLEIDSRRWFIMTAEQRQKHIKKVFDAQSISFESIDEQVSRSGSVASFSGAASGSSSDTRLSVRPDKSGITTIPAELLDCMWKKAEKLLSTQSICDAPGMVNAKCVARDSGEKPHIVSQNKRQEIICDDVCVGWKSQKICSHVLAVAELTGCLKNFLRHYRGRKTLPNYTAVVSHGLAKSVGSKPGSKTKRKGSASKLRPEVEVRVDPDLSQFDAPSNPDLTPQSPQPPMETTPVAGPLLSNVQVFQHNNSNTATGISSPVTVQYLPSTPSVLPRPFYSSGMPAVASAGPFMLKFLTPLIKICAGCRKGYLRASNGKSPPPPPMDLILVRQEQHIYYNAVNARQQLSSSMNVHYHANQTCPRLRFPGFNPKDLQIPDDVRAKLLPEHGPFLYRTFGVQ